MELVDTLPKLLLLPVKNCSTATHAGDDAQYRVRTKQTITNKKRLEEHDPKARQARFDELRATAEDPAKHKEFLLRTSLIASVRKAQNME
jgi:hypothetical protein